MKEKIEEATPKFNAILISIVKVAATSQKTLAFGHELEYAFGAL